MPSRQHQRVHRGARTWIPALSIASLLVCFTFIALEVVRGEPIAFDRRPVAARVEVQQLASPTDPAAARVPEQHGAGHPLVPLRDPAP